MPVDHYENFPVASFLLPRRLVPAVEAIYAFARSADDLADEGDAAPAERLAALHAYEEALGRIERHEGHAGENAAMFERLAAVIAKFQLPLKPFYDLLSAFKQDVETTRYASYDDVLDYCARSANPVGLLMLHLYGAADEQNVRDSDAICSALQLINFLQDVAIDQQKERIYLPISELQQFNVTAADLLNARHSENFENLMRFQVARAQKAYDEAFALLPAEDRRAQRPGLIMAAIYRTVLNEVERDGYHVLKQRISLTPIRKLWLAWKTWVRG